MMEREEGLGLRSLEESDRALVVPIRVWDGDKFPERLVSTIQTEDFRSYLNVRRGSKKWYEFQNTLNRK